MLNVNVYVPVWQEGQTNGMGVRRNGQETFTLYFLEENEKEKRDLHAPIAMQLLGQGLLQAYQGVEYDIKTAKEQALVQLRTLFEQRPDRPISHWKIGFYKLFGSTFHLGQTPTEQILREMDRRDSQLVRPMELTQLVALGNFYVPESVSFWSLRRIRTRLELLNLLISPGLFALLIFKKGWNEIQQVQGIKAKSYYLMECAAAVSLGTFLGLASSVKFLAAAFFPSILYQEVPLQVVDKIN